MIAYFTILLGEHCSPMLINRTNGHILSADFGYLRVRIFGTKFQTSVPMY